jgi:serine-type D-Ala-D-Ala carboxypeptidase (penicillin-binding protein 5/6)
VTIIRRTLALAAALIATAALMAMAAAPAVAQDAPSVPTADAAIVVDAGDGTVMFAKRPDSERSIASTTKLMTALLALERADPNDVFTAAVYNAMPAESRIDLRAGERMTVTDLLEALLLESANDAAVTLAEGVSGSREAFVEDMNSRAEELGLEHTSYANPIGLDEPGNYSTARDLASLTRRLMRRPRFARIVDMPAAELESGLRPRVVQNRNDLVAAYPWVSGVKTGYTLEAGNVLVGAANGRGRARVISVVLGEPTEAARNADTLALLRWGLSRFRRVRALHTERALAVADIEHRDETVRLVPRRRVVLTIRDGEELRRRVNAPEELEGPLALGERVGSVTVLLDGRPVRRVALVTAADVPGAGPLRVLLSVLGVPLTLLIVLAILAAAVLAILRLGPRIRIVR